MIERKAYKRLLQLSASFKSVAVIGPRQSGKTTLVKTAFPGKPYVSLENIDMRGFAHDDPRGFLARFPDGAILDEIQRVPALFSYLQEILDNTQETGKFILTGSNNFLLQENISQSLAGRIAYLQLLPFDFSELDRAGLLTDEEDKLMVHGFYPPLFSQPVLPEDWCSNYIRTYIERDVRQIKNITDLIVFERFLRLLAGRTGQELNLSALSAEVGVDTKTIQSWISVLENSFVIFLLRAHHRNFNKTIVKRPKVYFYDTGIVCSLLYITKPEQLLAHPLRGSIFETMIVSEIMKDHFHRGLPDNLFYWRSKTGMELDLIIDIAGELVPVEIKSAKTFHPGFLKNILSYRKLSGVSRGYVVYGGSDEQERSSHITVLPWKQVNRITT